MKKIIYPFILSLLTIYILVFPAKAIEAASFGLVLWYQKMLPTLLPFAILSYIFIHSGILDSIAGVVHKIIKWFVPVSKAGIYPLFAGFLFGFPLGSKITSELVMTGRMSREEGERLFCICNNISPLFIGSFILHSMLKRDDLKMPTFLMLYLPPLIFFRLTMPLFHKNKSFQYSSTKNTTSRSQIHFKIIDAGIMNGFETLTKLGGYIMLFAILAQMTTMIPVGSVIVESILIGIMEITNGISYTANTALPFDIKYPLIMLFTAFGGLSGLAQTASMTKEAGFKLSYYLQVKIICSMITFILAVLYTKLGL